MANLTPDELDVLRRIDQKEELRPYFFRKAKGLKWFDALEERGYFNPKNNPAPIPAQEEGFVRVPYWSAIEYLVNNSKDLADEKNQIYAEKIFNILISVTRYSVENDISNYRTWWQFSQILQNIPSNIISPDDLSMVKHWLTGRFDSDLVARQLGEKWLPVLLEEGNEHALHLAVNLLKILYRIDFSKKDKVARPSFDVSFSFDFYHAEKITEKVARLAGVKLGRRGVNIFDTQLKTILSKLENDTWSSIWHPAIEDHDQNKHRKDPGNIFIYAYRDALNGFFNSFPEEATEYVHFMLLDKLQTIQRLAINAIDSNFELCKSEIISLLNEKFFAGNFRHEMWHLLHNHYKDFTDTEKQTVIKIINTISKSDDNGNFHEGITAYYKSIWFSAIKDHSCHELEIYKKNVELAKTEPDHPDFASYSSVGWIDEQSPIPMDELQLLSVDELVNALQEFKPPNDFRESGRAGLVKALRHLIKSFPLNYYNYLNKFTTLDLAYIYGIIEAYRELWDEKTRLPWDEIWNVLLKFCSTITHQDQFWSAENERERKEFVANRYWIVSSIGRLLQAGTKSDDHAFHEKFNKVAELILSHLLNQEQGAEFKMDSDAVSVSINSPRGHCLEAFINLTLRSCRLSDAKNDKDHSDTWRHFQSYYDAELDRADGDNPEYEFVTLVANYLPNFLYISKDWTLENLPKIFDQDHYMKWLCAMQGYSYVGTVYQEVYLYLKEHGDFLKALDDGNIKRKVDERIITQITIAYIHGFEKLSDTDSLISILVSRNNNEELEHLIWFFWSQRTKNDKKIKQKIFELWPMIQSNIDFSTIEGRRMASKLCHWAPFIDYLTEDLKNILVAIAPCASEEHNAPDLLESLERLSSQQPFDVQHIWMKMLENDVPDYPEESIRTILANLMEQGGEGERKAKEVASEYLKKGYERPLQLLSEIQQTG